MIDVMDEASAYMEIIKKNIEYGRIWSDNRQGGGIVNVYYRRPVLDFY